MKLSKECMAGLKAEKLSPEEQASMIAYMQKMAPEVLKKWEAKGVLDKIDDIAEKVSVAWHLEGRAFLGLSCSCTTDEGTPIVESDGVTHD